uniref:CPG4 domain-containing protein n=1 Tax=Toxocara canis TaxID=6265 RepID=A0A183UXC3_TOXCA
LILLEGAINGHNCTAEEDQVIQHCAAPLNDLSSRIDQLFEGGLQAFLANVKNLAPVFAQGCNLTVEFYECSKLILQRRSKCVVSSCLIRAGEGICDQADTAKAIDDNLSCVFKQASNPEFGKCLRTTIATLKTFTLVALRTVLPRFISCIEGVVLQQCGETPLHLLRAISSTDVCPIEMASRQSATGVAPLPPISVCTPEVHAKHVACVGDFFRKYRMLPIAILNDASDIDAVRDQLSTFLGYHLAIDFPGHYLIHSLIFCQQVDAVFSCSMAVCEEPSARALVSMSQMVCARKEQFRKHAICLASVATSEQGAKCLTTFLSSAPENRCVSLSSTADCAAPLINDACGSEALTLSFDTMNQYAEQLNASCSISVPSVSLSTGCSETDLVEYLECETNIDRFAFNPISFIR